MAIVACSTPPGVSGIAVVRISGEDAIKNVSTFVKDSPFSENRPVSKICFLVDKDGEVFDEAIVTSYVSPNSYTGENLVEISCHGNPKIVSKIGDICIDFFRQNSIGTVIKHIPGHGLAKVDSHHYTPVAVSYTHLTLPTKA